LGHSPQSSSTSLAASSTRKPPYRRHEPPYRREYEHHYSGISHVCRPTVILNRKTEQKWCRPKKENDIP
jgi:hypothetical protein